MSTTNLKSSIKQDATNQMGPTRRKFVGMASGAAASAFAFTYIPSTVWGANDRVNVACIGVGGKGAVDSSGCLNAGANIVAWADVDDKRKSAKTAQKFTNAKPYKDYREMLEKEDKNIDAVTVSTPDHNHAPASVMALKLGKHVFCQKPLSHSIYETRVMTKLAREKNVATQMGNQAHCGEPIRRAVELIRAGMIGKVHEVHTWTNRPIWPQGMSAHPAGQPVPDTLDWDLWLGPAPQRDYNSAYCPFKWRGWWDYGTGALGDMGCHIMDMPFWALDLKAPTHVEAQQEGNTNVSGPNKSVITYDFAARGDQPAVKYYWWDGKGGNNMPSKETLGGFTGKAAASKWDLVMIGDKGKLFFHRKKGSFLTQPKNLLMDFQKTDKTVPRTNGVYREWLTACKGGAKAEGNWDYSGPLSEFVLLGNLAIRTGKKIQWDSANLKAVGVPEADQYIKREYRKGWSL